jgi:phosphoserine phosphatase
MKIAFDLDNTLIQNEFPFPIEAPNKSFWAKIMRFEPLREGTKEIFDFCKQQNWETWIYTTSFRNI